MTKMSETLKDDIIRQSNKQMELCIEMHTPMTIRDISTYTDAIQDMLYVLGYYNDALDFALYLYDYMIERM